MADDQQPPHSRLQWAVAVFTLVAAVVGVAVLAWVQHGTSAQTPVGPNSSQAERACEASVKAKLRFPASATFHDETVDMDTSVGLTTETPAHFRILGAVDAVTPAATYQTSNWVCTAVDRGEGQGFNVDVALGEGQ